MLPRRFSSLAPRAAMRSLLASTVLVGALAAPALAQQPDTIIRLNALEQQVRELNGRIEELNFFILQMQEELRRQKEDNEFRFQDLEGGASGASGGERRGDLSTGGETEVAAEALDVETLDVETSDTVIENDETVFNEPEGAGNDELAGIGDPPRDLGTLSVPEGTDSIVTGSLELSPEFAGDDTLLSAIEASPDHEALYERGYEFALAGDYARAEQVFRLHARRHPGAGTAPQSTYWLGESLLAQGRAEEAAEVLLDGHSAYGESEWAPDMLLKVGVAMARIGNRDIACATFDEVQRLYPRMPQRTANRVDDERATANC